MKTIEQLLELSKNPFYTFLPDEKRVLDDFLSKNQDTDSETSQTTSSQKSSKTTRVTARNVVEHVDTYAPDERTVGLSGFTTKDD